MLIILTSILILAALSQLDYGVYNELIRVKLIPTTFITVFLLFGGFGYIEFLYEKLSAYSLYQLYPLLEIHHHLIFFIGLALSPILLLHFSQRKVLCLPLGIFGVVTLFILLLSLNNFIMALLLVELITLMELLLILGNKNIKALRVNGLVILLSIPILMTIIVLINVRSDMPVLFNQAAPIIFLAWVVIKGFMPVPRGTSRVKSNDFLMDTYQIVKHASLIFLLFNYFPQYFGIILSNNVALVVTPITLLMTYKLLKSFKGNNLNTFGKTIREGFFLLAATSILLFPSEESFSYLFVYLLASFFTMSAMISQNLIKKDLNVLAVFMYCTSLYFVAGGPLSFSVDFYRDVFEMGKTVGGPLIFWSMILFFFTLAMTCANKILKEVRNQLYLKKISSSTRGLMFLLYLAASLLINFNFAEIFDLTRKAL